MRNQTIQRLASSLPLLLILLTSGCNTTSRNSTYAEQRTVTLKEWELWANLLTNSIIQAPSFNDDAAYPKPVTIAIGDFTNNSSRMDVGQDKDVFLSQLQKTLTNTNKIRVTRLYAGSGGRTDSITRLGGELTQDPQLRAGSTKGFDDSAEAALLVLALQFNQKRTLQRGRDTYENYFSVELIDQRSKSVVYTDIVPLPDKKV